MSAGIICPAAVSIRTNEALRENFNYHDSLGSPKFKRNELHMEKKPIIVRRPFKYVKHQGPRPVGAASISTFRFHDARCDANGLDSVRALSLRRAPNAASHERSSAHGSKFGRQQTGIDDLAHSSRKNEHPYEPPVSRLLSSRNLNLSALDISACQKKKTPQVEVVRDELTNLPFHTDSNLAQSPGTARLWEWFSQGRTSCFSDWSNSAPTSSRRSLTICETPTQLYLPKSSKEIAQKKRILSDSRLPLSLTCDSKAFHNTRSRSDFGLTNYS